MATKDEMVAHKMAMLGFTGLVVLAGFGLVVLAYLLA